MFKPLNVSPVVFLDQHRNPEKRLGGHEAPKAGPRDRPVRPNPPLDARMAADLSHLSIRARERTSLAGDNVG